LLTFLENSKNPKKIDSRGGDMQLQKIKEKRDLFNYV